MMSRKHLIKSIIQKKDFYSPEIDRFRELLSLSRRVNNELPKIMGSFNTKSISTYYGDIDLFQIVNINKKKHMIKKVISKFQDIIFLVRRKPNLIFTDCKLGIDENLRIIDETSYIKDGKVYGYDYEKSMKKINVLTNEEQEIAKKYLKPNPNEMELDLINKNLRFHILRWNILEILKGHKILRNGKKKTIEDGLKDNGIFKLDIIAPVNNILTEITIIYEIRMNNRRISFKKFDVEKEIQDDIRKYSLKGQYFKVLKRKFSLAKMKNDVNSIFILQRILNSSDLSKLYKCSQILEVLNILIENTLIYTIPKINGSINYLISILSEIYEFPKLSKKLKEYIFKLKKFLKSGFLDVNFNNFLVDFQEYLDVNLNALAFKFLNSR